MISSLVPSRQQQESAGEVLVAETIHALEGWADVHVLSRDGAANRRALQRGGAPPHTLIQATRRFAGGRLDRLLGKSPTMSFRDLLRHRHLVRTADTIDIQWEENAVLLPALRLLHPKARIVVTLHDVLSQSLTRARDGAPAGRRRRVLSLQTRTAKLLEAAICSLADHVVVLSHKDAALLPAPRHHTRVNVVTPPITGPLRPLGSATGSLVILFVGYMARTENADAVRWLATDILPRIRDHVPGARAVVAGGGMSSDLANFLEQHGVESLGFVDDLEPLYRSAALSLVPLRYGAGVKFKTVESLVRGVPVVTTRIGNEGVVPADAAVVADSAEDLARAAIRILEDPAREELRVRNLASGIAHEYGQAGFASRLKEIYA